MLELILGTLLGRFLPKMTRFKGSLDISLDTIPRTVFSVKPQNGSKKILNSTY